MTPELTDRIAAYVTHNLQLTSEPINTEDRDNLYAHITSPPQIVRKSVDLCACRRVAALRVGR